MKAVKKFYIDHTEIVNKPIAKLNEDDLKEIYSFLKWHVFRPQYFKYLPDPRNIDFHWNNRLKRAIGRCFRYPGKLINGKYIRLKKECWLDFQMKYFLKYPEDFISTFAHEMVHLFTLDGHGPQFQRVMNNINQTVGFQLVQVRQIEGLLLNSYKECLLKKKGK
jgi:hypothetical protein